MKKGITGQEVYGKKCFFSVILCVTLCKLCVPLCKFLIFCYSEGHREDTENHRGSML